MILGHREARQHVAPASVLYLFENLAFLVFKLLFSPWFSFTASVLEFDDSEKQEIYKTISFREVHDAIMELKVLALYIS